MALNLEKFVKGKRFTQEFTLDETLGQVLPKTASGSAIYTAIANYVSNNSSRVTVSATAPIPTGPGHLWYENDAIGRLFLWTGLQWVDASPNATGNGTANVTIAATPPTSPANGALWLDNADTYRLYVWNGVQWVDASPSNVSFDSVTLTGTPTAPTAANGTSTAQLATTAFVQTATGIAQPAGMVAYFSRSTPPTGWLASNGAAVSRTAFAALFGVIGTTFGAGDGTTTFNVPDLRGEFIRGWSNGRGVDVGRSFGSSQSATNHPLIAVYANSATTGTLVSPSISAYQGTYPNSNEMDGTADGQDAAGNNQYMTTALAPGGGTGQGKYFRSRPRNVALLACIKF